MKKRILSWALVLCMVLALLPGAAFAADTVEPSEDAWSKMLQDIGLSAALGGYFDSGDPVPDSTVFWYMQMCGALTEYLDQSTGYYTLPYDTYIALVDARFTNHSDMMEYMTTRDYYNAETGMLHWFAGGIGDCWAWLPLTVYSAGSTCKVQGLYLYGTPDEVTEDMQEYYDYYTKTGTYTNANGELVSYAQKMPIEAAVELTVVQTDDGLKIDGYTKINYYIIETEINHGTSTTKNYTLYERGEDGKVVETYHPVQLSEIRGARFVTTDGEPLTDALYTFKYNSNYWYVADEGFSFDVALDNENHHIGIDYFTLNAAGDLSKYVIEPNSGPVKLSMHVQENGKRYEPLIVEPGLYATITFQHGATQLEGYDGYWFEMADDILFTVEPRPYCQINLVSASTGDLTVLDSDASVYRLSPDFSTTVLSVDAEPSYTIENGVLTYDDPALGSAYLLTFDLDENAYCQGLVSGGSGTAKNTVILSNQDASSGNGYDYYFWPDSTSYLLFFTPEGCTINDFELEPADAGTLTQNLGAPIVSISLTAPATLHVKSSKQVVKESASGATLTAPVEYANWFYGTDLVVADVDAESGAKDTNLVLSAVGEDANVKLYEIHLESNGTVMNPPESVPMTITLPIPDGWNASKTAVYYVDSEAGTATDLNGVASSDGKTISFTTTHFSHYALVQVGGTPTIEPVDPCDIFTDVTRNWAYDGIAYCYNNGLMAGMTNTTFEPKGTLTRGQLVTILWRQAKAPKAEQPCAFTDLTMNYYKEAIAWAAENGIVAGVDATHFDPDSPISRQDTAAILYRYLTDYLKRDVSTFADITGFPDYSSVSRYAKEAMAWANAAGIISGDKIDGVVYLDPKGNATREQAARILMVFCEDVL